MKRSNEYELYSAFDAISFENEVPENVEEVIHRQDKNVCSRAMEREFGSIKRNTTWTRL